MGTFLRRSWIIIVAGVLAAFGPPLSPSIATAVWLSVGVLFVLVVVGVLARLRQDGEPSALPA